MSADNEWRPSGVPTDPELMGMMIALAALKGLDIDARKRALLYLAERLLDAETVRAVTWAVEAAAGVAKRKAAGDSEGGAR